MTKCNEIMLSPLCFTNNDKFVKKIEIDKSSSYKSKIKSQEDEINKLTKKFEKLKIEYEASKK